MSELTVQDVPWAAKPAFLVGSTFFVDKVGHLEGIKNKIKGYHRGRWEIGIRTSRGNKFAYAFANSFEAACGYVDHVSEFSVPELVEHLTSFDAKDRDSNISDLLLAQWREISYAWCGVVPGDAIAIDSDQKVETVDGTGTIRAGSVFIAEQVLLDTDRTIIAVASDGNVVEIPFENYTAISRRSDNDGRESDAHYVYAPNQGYQIIKEGRLGN